MEYFSIVAAICRAALKSPTPALENNISRLAKSLEKDGQQDQVLSLNQLLQNSKKTESLQPARVVQSFLNAEGEYLSASTKPPVDKESGTYLAEIILPSEINMENPHYDKNISSSLDHIIEEWTHIVDLQKEGLIPARSLMIFGPPGTGKTLMAHYIAKKLDTPLVIAKIDGLLSSFLGTTAKNISNLFSFANRYKCILLLDEFDAIAKLRDDPNELGEIKRVVNTLLQCLDARQNIGLTVAITNHENLLDPAIWRRFNFRISMPNPNLEIRTTIISETLYPFLDVDESHIRFLAWITEGLTGADIVNLTSFIKRKKAILKENFRFIDAVKDFSIISQSTESLSGIQRISLDDNEFISSMINSTSNVNFTQSELAKIFSISQPTLSRILRSKVKKGDA